MKSCVLWYVFRQSQATSKYTDFFRLRLHSWYQCWLCPATCWTEEYLLTVHSVARTQATTLCIVAPRGCTTSIWLKYTIYTRLIKKKKKKNASKKDERIILSWGAELFHQKFACSDNSAKKYRWVLFHHFRTIENILHTYTTEMSTEKAAFNTNINILYP